MSNPPVKHTKREGDANQLTSQQEHADTLDRPGAMVLAKRLQQYWLDQGYPAARF